MNADEVFRFFPGFGQAGDRQGRGVRTKHDVITELLGNFGGDLGFDFPALKHCFDDQIATGQVAIVGGSGDQ